MINYSWRGLLFLVAAMGERPVSTGCSQLATGPSHQACMLDKHGWTQVFCGNFEYDASERSVLELFEKYGKVRRIDMKTGELHGQGMSNEGTPAQ